MKMRAIAKGYYMNYPNNYYGIKHVFLLQFRTYFHYFKRRIIVRMRE